MTLTDIRLQNYRSYTDSSFELSEGVNIIVGPNAAGKSNLIEALMLVSNGVAYRRKKDLINTGSEWARIDVHNNQNEVRTLKLTQNTQPPARTYEISSKEYKRLPFTEKNPVVLFEPNNLFLLQGEPSDRREYIDGLLAQTSPTYSSYLSRFKRTLAQRNNLLKHRPGDKDQLFVWSLRFSELATKIIEERIKLVDKINQQTSSVYSQIAGKKQSVKLVYKNSVEFNSDYSAQLLKKLEKSRQEDIARGFTSYGPHRDDVLFELNKKAASNQASRGEIRTILLALKTIEINLLQEATGKTPLLLLDDVFSELDGARRKALTSHISGIQSVITTTDADVVIKNFAQDYQIIPLG